MPLTTLLTELHLQVLGYLDLISLLKATSTNKYFHALLKNDLLRGALMRHERVLLEDCKEKHPSWFPATKCRRKIWNSLVRVRMVELHARPYVCCSCYRIVPLPTLSHFLIGSPWELRGEKAGELVCDECNKATGRDFINETADFALDHYTHSGACVTCAEAGISSTAVWRAASVMMDERSDEFSQA